MSWLDWFRRSKPAALTGRPRTRRQKTYSAESGYVYQYYYEGQRKAAGGLEFVFDVSADRKTSFPVAVRIPAGAVSAWERSHGRALIANEWYAVAKMSLFRAFDQRETPAVMRQSPVDVDAEGVEEILRSLGRD